MNILFVNRMMGVSWGGGENYDYHLASALQAAGHSVVLVTGTRPGAGCATRPSGVETVCVETPYLRRYMYQLAGRVPVVPGLFAQADLRLFLSRSWSRITGLLAERSIDLIQILGIPRLSERLLDLGYPAVIRFPGPPAWFQKAQLNRISRRSRAAMFTHGDAVGHFRTTLGIGVHDVPPGVDRAMFRPAPAAARDALRQSLGIASGEFVLVTAGRLIEGKGHAFLLDSLRRRRGPGRVRLVVAGDGPLRARLEQKARDLATGVDVEFTGHLDREQLASRLQAADAFCLFSEYENYSNAVMEAMSSGLPVLASKVGGFPLQIRDGENGLLVEPGDSAGFLSRLETIQSDPELRTRLAAGAIRFAAGFSWTASAERVEEIYARLLQR